MVKTVNEYKTVYRVMDATWTPFKDFSFAVTNDLAVVTRAVIKKLTAIEGLIKDGDGNSDRLENENNELNLYISNIPPHHRITVPVDYEDKVRRSDCQRALSVCRQP